MTARKADANQRKTGRTAGQKPAQTKGTLAI